MMTLSNIWTELPKLENPIWAPSENIRNATQHAGAAAASTAAAASSVDCSSSTLACWAWITSKATPLACCSKRREGLEQREPQGTHGGGAHTLRQRMQGARPAVAQCTSLDLKQVESIGHFTLKGCLRLMPSCSLSSTPCQRKANSHAIHPHLHR